MKEKIFRACVLNVRYSTRMHIACIYASRITLYYFEMRCTWRSGHASRRVTHWAQIQRHLFFFFLYVPEQRSLYRVFLCGQPLQRAERQVPLLSPLPQCYLRPCYNTIKCTTETVNEGIAKARHNRYKKKRVETYNYSFYT